MGVSTSATTLLATTRIRRIPPGPPSLPHKGKRGARRLHRMLDIIHTGAYLDKQKFQKVRTEPFKQSTTFKSDAKCQIMK